MVIVRIGVRVKDSRVGLGVFFLLDRVMFMVVCERLMTSSDVMTNLPASFHYSQSVQISVSPCIKQKLFEYYIL